MDDNTKKFCKCGFDFDNMMIIPKARYNRMGYILLSLAYSARPIEIIFQCQNCGDILKRSNDRNVIEKYRYNSDIFKE